MSYTTYYKIAISEEILTISYFKVEKTTFINKAHHKCYNSNGCYNNRVPVLGEELLQRGNALVGQEDLPEGSQRSRGVNLGQE